MNREFQNDNQIGQAWLVGCVLRSGKDKPSQPGSRQCLARNSGFFLLLSFQCSESCDGGIQRRRAVCVNTRNDVLDDSKCTHQEKVTVQRCNEFPCPRWKSGDWSEVRGQGCHFPWVNSDIPTLSPSLPLPWAV